MKKFLNGLVLATICLSLSSCFGCDGSSSGYSSSSSREDDNYWQSIGREQQLRDAGMMVQPILKEMQDGNICVVAVIPRLTEVNKYTIKVQKNKRSI